MKREFYALINRARMKRKIFISIYFFFLITFLNAQTTLTFNTVGGGSWVAPCDVTSVTVEVWGAGGGGQRVNGNPSAGGGGSGGGYVRHTYTVTPNTTYNYYVGQGGTGNSGGTGQASWFVNNTTILAVGGIGAGAQLTANNTYGTGAVAATTGNYPASGYTVSTYGGNGGNANAALGSGGGGSSAGNTNGNPAIGPVFGPAPVNGYAGAVGVVTGGAVGNVGGIGAGGSGGKTNNSTDRFGGNGGNGQVRITYTSSLPTPSCYKTYTNIAPITKVTFAGIDNTTATTSTIANEIFCIAANVMQGQSYLISLKGNTLSTPSTKYTDYYTVFIDWNRDGDFVDANESINIGTLYGSTGIDATVLNGMITVPLTASVGSTKMRVVKNRSAFTDSCTNVAYGQAEDYTVIVAAIPACAGVPIGGTAIANPTSGATSSVFVASVSGATAATGLTYQWQSAPSATGPWTNIAYTGVSANIIAPAAATTTYYRRITICGANSTPSTVISYTTTSPTPCLVYTTVTAADGNENYDFIQKVSFLGTLHDTNNNSLWSTAPPGYQDFTNLTDKSIQATGNGVNVYVEAPQETYFKAWIDWNNDGVFTDSPVTINASGVWTGGERVYSSGSSSVHSTTFGFVVPTNVAAGDYKIRIKGDYRVSGSTSFNSCADFNNGGETEDYNFTVITNCSAIVSNVIQVGTRPCGGNAVQLRATGSATTTQFRWYDDLGVLQATTPAVLSLGVTTSDWSTPVLTTTKKYFVAAYNGTCESLIRIPIEARVLLVPSVSFSSTDPKICGEKSVVTVTAAGGNQIDYPVDEHFDSGSLGVFTNVNNTSNGATNDAKTRWQNNISTFIPAQLTWFPAIASGTNGNGFVISNSDINVFPVQHSLVSPTVDTSSFINLTLEFRMYFSRYNQDAVDPTTEYVEVEISTNNGASWTSIDHIINDVGIGTNFEKKTYNFNGYINQTQFKFRIRYYAGDWFDGVALDDVVLFGEKPFNTSFDWSSDNPIQVYSDAATTVPYTGTPINTIYVKPNSTELESYSSWDLSATALLTNGCSTTGDITIQNDTKVWNHATNDWKTSNWKPIAIKPDATNCIIVKTPVNLFTEDGIGKNLVIKPGGTLTVKTGNSLTIVDDITNETTASSFVVESDANLKQNNDAAVNSANLTVRRNANLKRLEYNYWGAPVTGQMLKSFSPNTVNSRFMTYNESDDLFYAVANPVTTPFTVGKGYAIRADNTYPTTLPRQVFNGQFVGAINNGVITTPINCTSCTATTNGFNLIGNPYPSNLDFSLLQSANSSLIYNTYYVWTNNSYNPAMQGSSYPGSGIINNYSVYTALGGLAAPYGFTGLGTNNPVNTNDPLGTPTCPSCMVPNKFIKVGQGFIVKAKTAGTLTFNNSMRSTDASSLFFNKNSNAKEAEIDRFWISLQTPLDFVSPILLGYASGATNDYELDYDAELLSEGSDSFYSLLNTQKLAIQGRYPFTTSDVIPLGANFYTTGTYVIRLDDKDGIFANGQAIYLKDKLLNTTVNLQDGNYTFTTNVTGAVLNRFEILYNYTGTLGTDTQIKKELLVYKQGNYFVIESPDVMNVIRLYDASGNLITERKPKSKTTRIETIRLINGVYVIDIDTTNKKYTKKVIK